MEGEVTSSSAGGSIPAGPRWNPTKEQISMLENWYKQGIRTPTADQIQQITARLQAYGHIEGKNVFYWFQNHKARQRQKQKQESLAFFTRCFHKHPNSPPVFPPPPPPNGWYIYASVSFIVLGSISGAHIIQHKANSGSILPTTQRCFSKVASRRNQNQIHQWRCYKVQTANNNGRQETLSLFPLGPTGVLQTRASSSSSPTSLVSTSAVIPTADLSSSSSGINGDHRQPYFDFFSGTGY
ncbi:hypothetical protein Vadar_019117 [Vaccinium darrowii]|uniref:Uncharacterized protein n=1 Tax=Vaccinium darrowii TaxID=229202 RepID=A0ACB7ZCS9_9ERIC|nr:hypothetical protein Vadar_019117 [Vaccinium darrowii]